MIILIFQHINEYVIERLVLQRFPWLRMKRILMDQSQLVFVSRHHIWLSRLQFILTIIRYDDYSSILFSFNAVDDSTKGWDDIDINASDVNEITTRRHLQYFGMTWYYCMIFYLYIYLIYEFIHLIHHFIKSSILLLL